MYIIEIWYGKGNDSDVQRRVYSDGSVEYVSPKRGGNVVAVSDHIYEDSSKDHLLKAFYRFNSEREDNKKRSFSWSIKSTFVQ